MNSRDLKPWQAEAIRRSLQPKIAYLHRLLRRMETKGFPPGDPYFVKVRDAYNAMHSLFVETHYMSVKGGVGRKPNA